MTFTIGNRVTWESQSAGYSKKKSGVVVAVVPPRQRVNDCIPCGFVLKSVPGKSRQHESYLVRVGTSASLYWPRVALLHKEVDSDAAVVLTDEEREAVEWASNEADDFGVRRLPRRQLAATLRGLLSRAAKEDSR
jgi:hypothetical protein